jgi:hypothetical protein
MTEEAEDRYPASIEAVRQNLGLDQNDDSKDDEIMQMSREEIFRRYMTWHGIIGYESEIKEIIEEIYLVALIERED